MPREWFSAAEIAAMRLPGMPTTHAKMLAYARREGWTNFALEGVAWRRRQARGGGIEFHHSVWLKGASKPKRGTHAVDERADAPVRHVTDTVTKLRLELLELQAERLRLDDRRACVKTRIAELRRALRGDVS